MTDALDVDAIMKHLHFVQTCSCPVTTGGGLDPHCPIHGKPSEVVLTTTYKAGDPVKYVDMSGRAAGEGTP